MHETLRTRILRRLETLPETKLYQVLDYIEFLESQYGERASADPSGLQRMAERLEDGLRKRTFNPSNVREAFQLISAADRVLSSISDAGRELLGELQAGGDVLLERSPERPSKPDEGGAGRGSPPSGGEARGRASDRRSEAPESDAVGRG